MTEAALAVAIAAIAITFFGVILQWLAYKATIEQAQRAAQSAAEMRVEFHDLVGELRGLTERMVEAQERQFNTMVEAFVTRPAAAGEVADKASESALALREVLTRLESLEGRVSEYPQVDKLGEDLREIARRVDGVAETASAAARLATQASQPGRPARPVVSHGMMHVGVEGFGRYAVDVVDLLREVKSLTESGAGADAGALSQRHVPKVMQLGSALGVALKEGLLSLGMSRDASEVSVVLTDKGRQLLRIIEDAEPGGLEQNASD